MAMGLSHFARVSAWFVGKPDKSTVAANLISDLLVNQDLSVFPRCDRWASY